MIAELGCECHEWPESSNHAAIESILKDSKDDMLVFADGSVRRGSESRRAFSARDGETSVRVVTHGVVSIHGEGQHACILDCQK